MKKSLFTAVLCLLSIFASGQKTGFTLTGGIGTYNMSELKDYQDHLMSKMPVDVRGLSYFPPFTNFKLQVFKEMSSGFKYGIVYAYSTSGAHANYQDFSGNLDLDQTVTAFQLGLSASYRLLYRNYFEISAYGDARISYIRDKVNLNISTSYLYDNANLNLNTLAPFLEGGLNAMYHFSKTSIGLEAAYLFDIGGNMNYNEDVFDTATQLLAPEGQLKSNFSGFRLGVKFILWFRGAYSEEDLL